MNIPKKHSSSLISTPGISIQEMLKENFTAFWDFFLHF